MQKLLQHIFLCSIFIFLLGGCSDEEVPIGPGKQATPIVKQAATPSKAIINEKKKVLFVNSYHQGYEWSDRLTEGLLDTFDAKINSLTGEVNHENSPVDLHVIFMDSRHKNDELEDIAADIYDFITTWQPDIIIVSDDYAAKHLVEPYLSDSTIPVVFCGLNWNATQYGFPTENMTGMIEIGMIEPLIEELKKYSPKGNRIGYLSGDGISERKTIDAFQNILNLEFSEVVFVTTYTDLKKEFLRLQENVDILIFQNNISIQDFDKNDALTFFLKNTRIPTGSTAAWISPYVLMTFSKVPNEQGEWAAITALQILKGTLPSTIPIAKNSKTTIRLNHDLQDEMGIVFPEELFSLCIYNNSAGKYSAQSISQKNYKGITLNILTHEIPNMGEPTALHATQFSKLTGAKINITHVPFSQLHDELLFGLKKEQYDVVFYLSLWIAEVQPHLSPIPHDMLMSEQYQQVLPHYKNISQWEKTPYQVPIDGDRHYLQYRRDILEDPKNIKLFQSVTDKQLLPPKTWEELLEISEVLKDITNAEGKKVAGIVEITKKDDLLFAQFIKRAAPYAKHPDVKGGFYFELETMQPLINTPGFVKALEDFVATRKYHPTSPKEHSLASSTESFGKGDAIFSDSWDDAFIEAMEPDSPIRNLVSALPSPGSRQVWNRRSNKWDIFPNVNYAPYIAHGWTAAVAANSKAKDAAFDFLGFFSNRQNHNSDLLVGRFGVNPFREGDLNESFWVKNANWDPIVAKSYINTIGTMSKSTNKVLDLRIHLSGQYMDSLSTGVYRALSERSTPQEALNIVADEWQQLTQRVGIDKQREAYRHIVNFEDNE